MGIQFIQALPDKSVSEEEKEALLYDPIKEDDDPQRP